MDQVRSPGRALAGTRGQALVETAMVMPLLLLLLVGIMEFGHAWSVHQVVTDAARQGARKAAIWHESGSGIAKDSAEAVVRRSLAAGSVNFDDATDDINVEGHEAGAEEATVTVEVEHRFFALAPVLALAGQAPGNGKVTLRSSAIMRNE